MQPGAARAVKPAVSVITTLEVPRARPLDCLASWTSGQVGLDVTTELIVVVTGRRPSLEREAATMLRPGDRLLRVASDNEMALYDAGARAACGTWLLFTEPHVEASPECIAALLGHTTRHCLAGACARTLPQVDHSRVARMEARMYLDDAAGWTQPGNWRTFTKRGVLVSREAYLDAGGLDGSRLRFAETALAERLHERGHAVGYAAAATIRHQNSTDLRELLAYAWEYRREEIAGRGAAQRVRRAVIADALGVATPHRGTAAWWRLAAALLAAGAPRGVSRVARGARPAARTAVAWMRFHRPGQDEDAVYAAYRNLWQAVGDLSVATVGRCTPGLHEPETWEGTPFRWSEPVASFAVPTSDRVVVEVVPIRRVGPEEVLVYRGARRLRPAEWTATSLRFEGATDGPVTIVVPPLPLENGDSRALGLPVVSVRGETAERSG
jgi:hypothetical protein